MSLNGIGRITEGMSEDARRAFLLKTLARNERARTSIPLPLLMLAREVLRPRLWLLVAVVAFLGWLSGYDVR